MKAEKEKKVRKHIALKVIAVILGLWVMLAVTDLIRFASSDGYIEPLITHTHMACGCGESRSECGIGYSFDYGYILDLDNSSWKYDKEKPDFGSFSVFGMTLYTRE